jgi:hypothetical protein
LKAEQFLFPSRLSESPHLSTRQYSRIVGSWVGSIGLHPGSLRYPFDAAHQTDADIPADEESSSRPTSPRP